MILTIIILEDDGRVLHARRKAVDCDPFWLIGVEHNDNLLSFLGNGVVKNANLKTTAVDTNLVVPIATE